MTVSLEWRNAEKTILAKVDGLHTDIIESGHPEWETLSKQKGIKAFVPDTFDVENLVRQKRNRLLSDCDWTQLSDAPVDQSAWAAYRQALRDVTKQEGFPENVSWPVAPI